MSTVPSTTFVLGAGFSRAANVPVQAELEAMLLSDEFDGELDLLITRNLKAFLKEVFGWREGRPVPLMEDVFTGIDLSAQAGYHLGIKYSPKMLRALRRMAIHRVFSALDRPLSYSPDIETLLGVYCDPLCPPGKVGFVVLNWDIILEKHLARINPGLRVDYCCSMHDWAGRGEPQNRASVPVCKMFGSSNWVYCDNCHALFCDLDSKLSIRTKAGLSRADFQLFGQNLTPTRFEAAIGVSEEERACRFCGNRVSSHIATFSYRKSLRTPAYSSSWHYAEQLLSRSDRWVFIGYSLPEPDYEFKHLLKVAQLQMAHRRDGHQRRIEVVVRGDAGTRVKFERFFGDVPIAFFDGGLSEYVARSFRSAA